MATFTKLNSLLIQENKNIKFYKLVKPCKHEMYNFNDLKSRALKNLNYKLKEKKNYSI
jgi:hypothetical protein